MTLNINNHQSQIEQWASCLPCDWTTPKRRKQNNRKKNRAERQRKKSNRK